MKPYKNLSGNSGVKSYEIRDRSIVVQFQDGTYIYDYLKTGKREVEQMKILAEHGRGLSTYIATHVRERFAKKVA
jgi:hypothetical protein